MVTNNPKLTSKQLFKIFKGCTFVDPTYGKCKVVGYSNKHDSVCESNDPVYSWLPFEDINHKIYSKNRVLYVNWFSVETYINTSN